jgi:hypothetical protein
LGRGGNTERKGTKTAAVKPLPVVELAARINEHLTRFESDPAINKPLEDSSSRMKPFFNARAWKHGNGVGVCYVSYQGASQLTRAQAAEYLAWLDAGNTGKHRQLFGPGTVKSIRL